MHKLTKAHGWPESQRKETPVGKPGLLDCQPGNGGIGGRDCQADPSYRWSVLCNPARGVARCDGTTPRSGFGAGVLSSAMRRLSTSIVALLCLLAFAGAITREAIAQGDIRTGTEMLAACRAFLEVPKLLERATQELTLRAGFCAGYVSGIMAEETEACIPPVTATEAVRVIVDYLEKHSDELDKPFDVLVERALIATWPCTP